MINQYENMMKQRVLRATKGWADVQSHEDMLTPGIPDLSYGANYRGQTKSGWIELKYVRAFNRSGIAKPTRFTPLQINWLKRRGWISGGCFVMMGVGKATYLFSFHQAEEVRDGLSKKECEGKSLAHWNGTIDAVELVKTLVM